MGVSLVPFQIFFEKVMVLLFHHPHVTACLLLPDVLAGKQHWEWCGQWHEAVKTSWCGFHLIQWLLCDLVSCPAKTPMSSWMETALQMDFKNKYLVWLSKIQPVQKYKASMLWMSTCYQFFSWGWKEVLSIFTRSMLLFSCEGFQHFGHYILKKSLSALALQGLLSAAFLGLWRWHRNGSAFWLPFPSNLCGL